MKWQTVCVWKRDTENSRVSDKLHTYNDPNDLWNVYHFRSILLL